MDNITISRDEYDALCALRTRAAVFETLARANTYMSIGDALLILGFEPVEKEDAPVSIPYETEGCWYAGEQNAD